MARSLFPPAVLCLHLIVLIWRHWPNLHHRPPRKAPPRAAPPLTKPDFPPISQFDQQRCFPPEKALYQIDWPGYEILARAAPLN